MWDLIFNRNKKHLPNYFSFSQISSYEMCPLQYKLVYIDGIKRKYESIESFMGKRVHGVLEWLYKPENKEKLINFDKICEVYDKGWVDKWNPNIFVVNVKYNRKDKKYEYPLLSAGTPNLARSGMMFINSSILAIISSDEYPLRGDPPFCSFSLSYFLNLFTRFFTVMNFLLFINYMNK